MASLSLFRFLTISFFLHVASALPSFPAISGQITNDLGEPVHGAAVTFTDESNSSHQFSAFTDGNGRYTVDITSSGVNDNASMPEFFSLGQNFPNPFNPSTVIPFTLEKTGIVDLSVYSVLGQKTRMLVNGPLSAGYHSVVWNGRDNIGRSAAAGIYLYRLQSGSRIETKKMLFLDGGGQPLSSNTGITSNSGIKNPSKKIALNTAFRASVSGKDVVPFQKGGVLLTDGNKLDFSVVRTSAPGAVYSAQVLAYLDRTEATIASMKAYADSAAARLAAGGQIYVTGDEDQAGIPGGFSTETLGRAGGIYRMMTLPSSGNVKSGDVVLAGTMDLATSAQANLLSIVRSKKALIILFGSKDSPVASLADYIVDNGFKPGIAPVMLLDNGTTIGPLAGVANVIGMWTFSSELVASVNRLGKMLNMYQSGFVTGANARNSSLGTNMFQPNTQVSPIQPGVLGRQYISALRGFMAKIRTEELPDFCRAGMLCAAARAGNHNLILSNIGHYMDSQARMVGYPQVFSAVLDNKNGVSNLQGKITKDDVWVYIGYSSYPVNELNYASQMGTKTVSAFCSGTTSDADINPSLMNVYIDPYWRLGDAVVDVPGYDIKVIPPSGVVMVSCYWMILGEIADRI
jgi:hypothetical protein